MYSATTVPEKVKPVEKQIRQFVDVENDGESRLVCFEDGIDVCKPCADEHWNHDSNRTMTTTTGSATLSMASMTGQENGQEKTGRNAEQLLNNVENNTGQNRAAAVSSEYLDLISKFCTVLPTLAISCQILVPLRIKKVWSGNSDIKFQFLIFMVESV